MELVALNIVNIHLQYSMFQKKLVKSQYFFYKLLIMGCSVRSFQNMQNSLPKRHQKQCCILKLFFSFFLARFSIGILMIMLVIGNLCLSLYGLIWPWFVSISSWGQLMQKYSDSLNKIDVARGRCVPMPSSVAHSSRFSLMASPLQMLTQSNVISKKVSAKTSIERIVDALNPYTASPNIRLILDMVAYKYLYNLYYYTGDFYMYIVDILILLVFNQELLLFQIWHWSSFENFGIFGNRCPQQLEAFQTSTEIHSR